MAAPPALQDPQWQCGLCKFCSVTQQEMLNHTSLKHSIRSQFKCGYCSVRSSVRTSFDAHFAAKHPTQQFRVSIIFCATCFGELQIKCVFALFNLQNMR